MDALTEYKSKQKGFRFQLFTS